jgi:nucleoside triphosphate diphosphatase
MNNQKTARLCAALQEQIEIMARLRAPENGCPWDIVQTFKTIAPFTIEEAYEVADAINKNDMNSLKEELGDLIFQVAFHSRMAEENNEFDIIDVIVALNAKMISRHPHVFGKNEFSHPDEVAQNWEILKAKEREIKIKNDTSILADIALPLPALSRAWKLSKRAARVGFDWPDYHAIFDKLSEEITETKEAIEENDTNHITEEIGDCLFVLANLARKFDIDPEAALKSTNDKFERRFRTIEAELEKIGKTPSQSNLDEMEALWLKAKLVERGF